MSMANDYLHLPQCLFRRCCMSVQLFYLGIMIFTAGIDPTIVLAEYQAPPIGTIPYSSDHLVAADIAMLTNCNGNDTNPAFTPSPYAGVLQAITPNSSAAFGTPPNGLFPATLRSGTILAILVASDVRL